MQTSLMLITWTRLSGSWAAGRLAQLRSALSSVAHRLTQGLYSNLVPVPIPVRVPRFGASVLLPALMLAALSASPAAARYNNGVEAMADGRLVDVQVQVEGRTAPLYLPTDGSNRHYFQAFRGRHYALVVTNNTGRRVGVLIAVDGLNVVNGERSRLASDEAMYVLDPWERTVISGWRSSLDHVRQFVFVDEEHSYAERTGQANGDLGWVRVLAFNERGQRWWNDMPGRINQREKGDLDGQVFPYDSRDEGRAQAPELRKAPQAGADRMDAGGEAPDESNAAPEVQGRDDVVRPRQETERKLYGEATPPAAPAVPGTGWGEKRWDPVRRVWFVPERYATDQIVLRYEYASGLRALGIVPRGFRDRLWERERGELGFAQPPRW